MQMYTDMIKSNNGLHPKGDVIKDVFRKDEKKIYQEEVSTIDTSSNSLIQRKPALMGCPFFSKEITDPLGKNFTQGYP